MEEHNKFKKKIMKGSLIFLTMMLVLTILSKTIYTLLLPRVTLTRVSKGTVENKFLAVGKIGRDLLTIKSQKVAIKMPVEGSLLQCFARENQSVKKGETLFEIQVEADEKERVEAEYYEKEHRIKKESLERQQVEKLSKKAEVEEKIAEQKTQVQQGEESYKMIEIEQQIKEQEEELTLNEQLYLEGLVSETEYKKGHQLLELLKKEKQEIQKEEQTERGSKLAALQEELETLKSELSELQEKQALEESKFIYKADKEKGVIVTSPLDGVIYKRDLAVGANGGRGEKLATMIPDDVPITLSFEVNDVQANAIKVGQEVTWILNSQDGEAIVTKKTYDETSGETIITCQLQEEVIKQLALEDNIYKTVDVEVTNNQGQYNLVVPNTALIREGSQTYVYSLEEIQNTFEITYCVNKIPVTVIKEGDDKSAVAGALSYKSDIIRTTSKPLAPGREVVKN